MTKCISRLGYGRRTVAAHYRRQQETCKKSRSLFTLLGLFASAPAASSSFTTATWPGLLAHWRGVLPNCEELPKLWKVHGQRKDHMNVQVSLQARLAHQPQQFWYPNAWPGKIPVPAGVGHKARLKHVAYMHASMTTKLRWEQHTKRSSAIAMTVMIAGCPYH